MLSPQSGIENTYLHKYDASLVKHITKNESQIKHQILFCNSLVIKSVRFTAIFVFVKYFSSHIFFGSFNITIPFFVKFSGLKYSFVLKRNESIFPSRPFRKCTTASKVSKFGALTCLFFPI